MRFLLRLLLALVVVVCGLGVFSPPRVMAQTATPSICPVVSGVTQTLYAGSYIVAAYNASSPITATITGASAIYFSMSPTSPGVTDYFRHYLHESITVSGLTVAGISGVHPLWVWDQAKVAATTVLSVPLQYYNAQIEASFRYYVNYTGSEQLPTGPIQLCIIAQYASGYGPTLTPTLTPVSVATSTPITSVPGTNQCSDYDTSSNDVTVDLTQDDYILDTSQNGFNYTFLTSANSVLAEYAQIDRRFRLWYGYFDANNPPLNPALADGSFTFFGTASAQAPLGTPRQTSFRVCRSVFSVLTVTPTVIPTLTGRTCVDKTIYAVPGAALPYVQIGNAAGSVMEISLVSGGPISVYTTTFGALSTQGGMYDGALPLAPISYGLFAGKAIILFDNALQSVYRVCRYPLHNSWGA